MEGIIKKELTLRKNDGEIPSIQKLRQHFRLKNNLRVSEKAMKRRCNDIDLDFVP